MRAAGGSREPPQRRGDGRGEGRKAKEPNVRAGGEGDMERDSHLIFMPGEQLTAFLGWVSLASSVKWGDAAVRRKEKSGRQSLATPWRARGLPGGPE